MEVILEKIERICKCLWQYAGVVHIIPSSEYDEKRKACQSAISRLLHFGAFVQGGGDRSRTGVQTYSSKAFYMFILFCYVGNQLETDNRLIP